MTMLEKLLAEVHSGGTLETRTLAKKLGTTPAMVEAMLEHLERSGMLKVYQGCSGACPGCALKDACQRSDFSRGMRIWHG